MVYDVTSTYLGIVQSCQNADRDTDSTQPLNHLSTSIINDFVLQERKKVIKTSCADCQDCSELGTINSTRFIFSFWRVFQLCSLRPTEVISDFKQVSLLLNTCGLLRIMARRSSFKEIASVIVPRVFTERWIRNIYYPFANSEH